MSNGRGKKVFVGMSGGVDSSVAAALLLERGYDVTGVHMKCFNVDGCAERDAEDARRVAEQLGIPFYTFDFEEAYKQRVVQYMIHGYKNGITPNPDVMCNKEIKFGLFLEKALALGADYVATGHYVKLAESPTDRLASFASDGFGGHRRLKSRRATPTNVGGRAGAAPTNFLRRFVGDSLALFAAKDVNKDQSYFLWTLAQKQLKHCLFPIGDYAKPQVRKLAKRFGLLTAEKKDSQGICFLGQVGIQDFLKDYIPEKRGRVLNLAGETIGFHKGAHFYTIGQRSGLNSGSWQRASRGGSAEPFYVVSKDIKKNTITVSEGDVDPMLYCKEINLVNVNIINPKLKIENCLPTGDVPKGQKLEIKVLARVRYRQPLAKAKLELKNLRIVKLIFDKPQKYVAEGQSAVFYLPAVAGAKVGSAKNLEMLGGGVISN